MHTAAVSGVSIYETTVRQVKGQVINLQNTSKKKVKAACMKLDIQPKSVAFEFGPYSRRCAYLLQSKW